MIRAARFGDIPRMTEILLAMHSTSKYAGHVEVDVQVAKRLFMNAIQRHGGKHEGCSLVMVSEHDDAVTGFMIGLLDRVYHVGDKLAAKDLYLFVEQPAGMDAVRLIDAYIEWAEQNPKVHEINLSWTDTVSGAERIGDLYERKGFRRSGAIYERVKP